jgi:chromo domain-containing protein 1
MESSDDDISITSTPGSVQKDEYEVEAVIGERAFRGNLMYLVKWAGYPLERCTWEPPNSFCNPQTLADWEAKMEAIAQKKEKPFDVDALLKSIDAIEGAKALRRQRRKAKRIRLEIPVSPSVSSGDTEASWSLNGFIVGDDVDVTAEIPAQTSPQKREEKQKASGTELRRRTDKPQDDKAALSSDSDSPLSKLRNNPGSSPATRKQPSQTNASAGTASTPTSKPASSQPAPASSRPAPPPVSAPKSNDPARKQRPVLSLKTTTKATPSASAPKSAPKSTTSSPSLSSKPRSSAKQFGVPGIGPSNPKRFTTLQLKNRHNKFIRRELVPDISRLDLKTPSEWAAQKQTAFVVPAPPPGRRVSEDSDSLFVEQESPRSFRNRSPIRNDDSGPSRRRSAVAASTARMSKDTSPVKPPPPYKMRSPALPGNWPWRRFKMHSDELFVRLGLGSLNNVIGDVRITGINSRTMKQMVPLRGPHSRIILNFRDTCNFDEYKELCESVRNPFFPEVVVLSDLS